jgi:hypothetical protein
MSKRKADRIELTNKKILSFFGERPNLDVEQTILSFIDIMQRLSDSLNGSIDTNLVTNILQRMKNIETNVSTINSNLTIVSSEILSNISLKMNETRSEFMEQLKLNLTANTSTQITPFIKEQSDYLFERTSNVIKDILPKNHDSLSGILSGFQKDILSSIESETKSLTNSSLTSSTLDDFFSKIEQNINHSQQNLETKIQNNLSTTSQLLSNSQLSIEQKMETQQKNTLSDFTTLKDICEANKNRNEETSSKTNEILKKLGNSSHKGIISENFLVNIITPLYPCAEIKHVGQTEKESGDIILIRENKPTILIDNKNYESQNPSTEEVNKFIRDVKKHKCCGLFLSQHTGVALKQNWEINIEDSKVVIYLHQVNNNPDIIKTAVSIIDAQQKFYDSQKINDDTELSISKEQLDRIHNQFREFTTKRIDFIKKIDENHRTEKKMIEDLVLSELDNYLQKFYQYTSSQFQCDYCNRSFKNRQALASHHKGCAEKKNKDSGTTTPIINVET